MTKLCQKIAASDQFQIFILWVILITAASMGLETVPELQESFGLGFTILFYATQFIFVVEMLIRLQAFAPRYSSFFSEFRNTFDLLIVIVSLIPGPGAMAPIVRLVRVLRVLRIVSTSDRLRRFFETMQNTKELLIYSAAIVGVLGYIFTISGHYLFFEITPEHWGTLSASSLTVFYLLLLQDVPQVVSPLVKLAPLAITYFILFYFVFICLLLNVIGLINNAHRESRDV